MGRPGSRGMAMLAVAMVFAASAMAAPQPARVRPLSDGVEVRVGPMVWRVTAVRDDIVRVRIGPRGELPEDASWAVLPAARTGNVAVRAFAENGAAGFRTAALTARIDLASGRLIVEDPSGAVIVADSPVRPLTIDDHGFVLRKALPEDEHIFGLGDKAGPLDRRGEAFALWNTDAFGWQESSDPLYKSIPFFIGANDAGRAYGLLLDNSWRTAFDFGRGDRGALTMSAEDGPIDYYVMAGPTPKQVVEAYAWLTGPSPMPPLWALGYQQSRYSYMTDGEVRGIAARLRAEHIPADAIYLDIDYQDRDRPFTVNAKAFPDLPKLTGDLRADGLRLIVITDLHIAVAPGQGYTPYDTGMVGDHFVKAADGKTYVGEVWPGPSMFPDFTRAATRDWWGGLYLGFHDAGVSGFWNDMNEPAVFGPASHSMPLDVQHRIDEPGFAPRTASHLEIHNIFGMENSRATYEGLLRMAPNERPFVLTRASFAGGQRYAATWTGDNSSTWNHLRISLPMLQNLGLSGFAWSGADVGGFAGSPSAELLTRWIEIAAFTPLFRDHAAKGTAPHEPWVDGTDQTAIRRRFIEERYRLIPYLYALADETARTGLPVMRPEFLEFPAETARVRTVDGAFMLGAGLLVAPQPMGETKDAWEVSLPTGGWFDYWTGRPVPGRMVHEIPDLGRLPVFVRPGTILPRQAVTQSTAERPAGPLEIGVYPGPDCHGSLYWDDGHSRDRGDRAVLRQDLTCAASADHLIVTFAARRGGFPPWWTSIALDIHGWTGPAPVVRLNGDLVASRFDPATQCVRIVVPDQSGSAVLTIG